MKEVISYNANEQIVLIVKKGKITANEMKILKDLSSKFCGKLDLGWIDLDSDPNAETLIPTSGRLSSNLVYIDKTRGISYVMTKAMNPANAIKFVTNITTNSLLNDRQTDPKWPLVFAATLVLITFLINWKCHRCCLWMMDKVERSEFVQYW
ncbi:hypothetical protein TVAG_418020 [Trichomonas vaginalis G3]|uniref:Uncharacterized protein n=1 Tax=Trichomonas vaginalis (strain ATCC PRA-98 / G3) TaxID=412133 RepID=A2EDC2_TRIV3|nr:hypothetical protein TVAGG3_0875960 [Trichomonas vaginalis G3]EAY09380.1 hypothetical protein TVAG_418020 [Trichomonas vaginalis G3]KAI5501685.1 hypothetical protein TVAGG3_0875960 [Trichomonas vaginalis G3]|eukprot:XP_001321603.1 hypothetical protein [Trichomonas vaginalis G3]